MNPGESLALNLLFLTSKTKQNTHKKNPQPTPIQTPHRIVLTGVIFSQLFKAYFPWQFAVCF